VVAFVAFTHGSGNNNGGTLEALSKDRGTAAQNVPVYTVAGDFTLQSAQSRLLDVSKKVPPGVPQSYAAVEGTPTGGPVPVTGGAVFDTNAMAREQVPTAAIDRCVASVTRSATDALTPLQYELVTFEKKPAFFLFFSTPERVELWVVTRDRCEVLYFAQTA
jgi:hypothetical protein